MTERVSLAELGRILGKGRRTVTRWRADGMPVHDSGPGLPVTARVDEVHEWMRQTCRDNGEPVAATTKPSAPVPVVSLDRLPSSDQAIVMARRPEQRETLTRFLAENPPPTEEEQRAAADGRELAASLERLVAACAAAPEPGWRAWAKRFETIREELRSGEWTPTPGNAVLAIRSCDRTARAAAEGKPACAACAPCSA